MKIGAVTIGQSPRVDVTPDIMPIFGDEVELLQMGALDGLSKEDIAAMVPREGDYILVSRLNDGSFAKFSESYIAERMQQCVTALEEQGAVVIMVMCAGEFPLFKARVPVIYPGKVLDGLAAALTPRKRLIVITPDEQQLSQAYRHWGPVMDEIYPFAANPYGPMSEVEEAAAKAKDVEADLVVMDCIGFSVKAKEILAKATGLPVLLCRTVLARTACEVIAGLQ